MKRRLYQKLILAWICFAVLSFVSVAGITSSLVEKHLIKNKTEGMYREANVIAAGRLAQNYTERASLQDTYTNLLAVASYQSMRLWLMDSNGKILIDTAVGYDQSKITQLDSFDPASLSGNYYQTGRFLTILMKICSVWLHRSHPTTSRKATLQSIMKRTNWKRRKIPFSTVPTSHWL